MSIQKEPKWSEWINSESLDSSAQWRSRIEAGETGNKSNPIIASHEAFDAGVRRGRYEAICALAKLIESFYEQT